MNSEHHWLDEIFLKDLMFDNFEGKSWSDELDERDLENAKTEYETEINYSDEGYYYFVVNDGSYEAEDFVHCWIEAYYADSGFDNGLLTFKIMKWGDDGPNTIYYEVEIKRKGKTYQTLYIALSRRDDGEWRIFEVQAK